jgi:hypothetical protein
MTNDFLPFITLAQSILILGFLVYSYVNKKLDQKAKAKVAEANHELPSIPWGKK